jgi:hypothetical protein
MNDRRQSWAASASVALVTAAWLSGDPLSWQQVLGGATILSAGLGDVLSNRDSAGLTPVPAPVAPER